MWIIYLSIANIRYSFHSEWNVIDVSYQLETCYWMFLYQDFPYCGSDEDYGDQEEKWFENFKMELFIETSIRSTKSQFLRRNLSKTSLLYVAYWQIEVYSTSSYWHGVSEVQRPVLVELKNRDYLNIYHGNSCMAQTDL